MSVPDAIFNDGRAGAVVRGLEGPDGRFWSFLMKDVFLTYTAAGCVLLSLGIGRNDELLPAGDLAVTARL